jgi:hypothetical protein
MRTSRESEKKEKGRCQPIIEGAEHTMTHLVIHDLPESVELDKQAMAAITGGAMVQAHQTIFARRQTFTGLALATAAHASPLEPFEPFVGTGWRTLRTTLLR